MLGTEEKPTGSLGVWAVRPESRERAYLCWLHCRKCCNLRGGVVGSGSWHLLRITGLLGWEGTSRTCQIQPSEQPSQGCVHLGFEHLQEWRLCILYKQFVPVDDHSTSTEGKKATSYTEAEFPVFQCVCCLLPFHWIPPGRVWVTLHLMGLGEMYFQE